MIPIPQNQDWRSVRHAFVERDDDDLCKRCEIGLATDPIHDISYKARGGNFIDAAGGCRKKRTPLTAVQLGAILGRPPEFDDKIWTLLPPHVVRARCRFEPPCDFHEEGGDALAPCRWRRV